MTREYIQIYFKYLCETTPDLEYNIEIDGWRCLDYIPEIVCITINLTNIDKYNIWRPVRSKVFLDEMPNWEITGSISGIAELYES